MKAIEIVHCQATAVTSRQDGSVKIGFVTPELRPSEAGVLIGLHGKNCCVSIVPEDVVPDEKITVDTQRGTKTPSQRIRACLFVLWQQTQSKLTFDAFYAEKCELFINQIKEQLE